jgi:ribosome maturation factor RimP
VSFLDIVRRWGRAGVGPATDKFWISHLTDTAAIARLIEPAVKELGFDLVRVAMIGGKSDPTLQVMAERPDTRQLSIDDCADLSRRISDILDEADPIEEGYRLEVSSPGIDRPLTRRSDFADWTGHEARIKFVEPVDGAKQVSGDIEGIDGETIRVATPKGDRLVDFANIASAKLILTDKLINATAPLNSEGAEEFETEEE